MGPKSGCAPLKAILDARPQDLPAVMFVVLHIPARSIGLPATVAQATRRLPVRVAEDGRPVAPGRI